MNKKFKNLFLAGALVLGLAGVAVSCTDYDDDINKLQSDIQNTNGTVSTLQGTVQELQNKINSGFVITSVAPLSGEPGGWKFTTSDGKTYDVTNGAKGDKGDKGDPGENGKDGKDGKDGIWFTPDAETGTWIKHEIVDGKDVPTDTEQSIIPNGFMNVEFDADTNTLTIIAGEDEFVIELNGSSASFVFVPQAVVDGVNALEMKNFAAMILTGDKLDSKDEIWYAPGADKKTSVKRMFEDYLTKELKVKDIEEYFEGNEVNYERAMIEWAVEQGYMVYEPVPALAQYHVNYDTPLDTTFEYKLITKDTRVYTRVESSEDFAMNAEFVSYADGILTVQLSYEGDPARPGYDKDGYSNHMTQFALQVTKGEKTYTSDYATFVVKNIFMPRIADPRAVVEATEGKAKLEDYNWEEHYRRGTAGISGKDKGSYFGDYDDYNTHEYFAPDYVAPWIEGTMTLDEAHATCDTAVAYTATLNLNEITIPHYDVEGEFCYKPVCCWDGRQYIDNEPILGFGRVNQCFEMTPEEMEEFNLHFEYEVVQNYKIGAPVTDQANFVEHNEDFQIEDGIFKPAVYDVNGTAAIGRTPIIRVKLMRGEDIINVAYIKVFIKKDANATYHLIPRRDPLDNTSENVFHFYCEGDMLMTTVEDMNKELYNPTKHSKDDFHALYDSITVVLPKDVTDTIGTVRDSVVNPVEGTHVIVWELGPEDLWKYAGKDVSIIARYISKNNTSLYVDVLLTASVAPLEKGVNVKSADGDYITEMWTSGYKSTRYNVMPAPKDDSIGRGAQMVTDINASFVTYPENDARRGQLMVEAVDSVVYYFCKKDVEKITQIGDLNVKFLVDDEDALTAWNLDTEDGKYSFLFGEIQNAKGKALKGYEMQPVAVIVNGHDDATAYAEDVFADSDLQPYFNNIFVWVKNDWAGNIEKENIIADTTFHVADTLINTGVMYTYIAGTAFLCTEGESGVEIKFDGKDHFQADIVRPLEVNTVSTKGYIDGVDYGEEGSYISIADLLNPVDWRKRTFTDYPNYWGYYGVDEDGDGIYGFEVLIDTKNVECEINGKRQHKLSTMYIYQVMDTTSTETIKIGKKDVECYKLADPVRPSRTVYIPKNDSGYLMYFNNGDNLLNDFKLFVKATLRYGFGYFNTDWVTVPVAKTINQDVEGAGNDEPGEGGEGGDTPGEGGEGGDTPGEGGEGGETPGEGGEGGETPGGETPAEGGEGGETPATPPTEEGGEGGE